MYGEIVWTMDGWPDRSGLIEGRLVTEAPLSGAGELSLLWTDALGRTVWAGAQRLEAEPEGVAFSFPAARSLTALNRLSAAFATDGGARAEAQAEFYIVPPADVLDDYTVIMYYPYKPHQQDALRQYSITHGKIQPKIKQAPLDEEAARHWYWHGFRFYCDQTAVPLFAEYHSPVYEPKQKKLLEAKALYAADRSSLEAFVRKPSFHDEAFVRATLDTLKKTVESQKRLKPLFYSTDEVGVADLVAAWDFDFDPRALEEFRSWLLGQYGSLEALNDAWETDFPSWPDVLPFTTDQMLARGGDNFSPWADHRHFMNSVFARGLLLATDAVHEADPEAKAGIVGGQMPSAFGGYDYWLLSKAIDVIEPYNIGNNRELWRSFAPDKPALITSFAVEPMELWRHWYQALHGDRGVIIYDEQNRYLDEQGRATPYAQILVPLYRELTGGIVRQLAQARHNYAPVAIHYSHASITANWMKENRGRAFDWLERGSADERLNSAFLRLRESCVKLCEDNLIEYDFLAYGQIEEGALLGRMPRLLMLPQSIAISPAEADAIRAYVRAGGTVVADAIPAVMDEHCRTLAHGQLDDLFGVRRAGSDPEPGEPGLTRASGAPDWATGLSKWARIDAVAAEALHVADDALALYQDAGGRPALIVRREGEGRAIYLNMMLTDYHRYRLRPPQDTPLRELFGAIFELCGVEPIAVVSINGGGRAHGVEAFRYDFGKMQMFAFLHNFQLRVSELGPPEYRDQSALEGDWDVTVTLPVKGAVYDARAGRLLGQGDTVSARLPAHGPLILSVFPEPVGALTIDALRTFARGDALKARFTLEGGTLGDFHAIHVSLTGPDGVEIECARRNVLAEGGSATYGHPTALSDALGVYTLSARDIPSGSSASVKIELV